MSEPDDKDAPGGRVRDAGELAAATFRDFILGIAIVGSRETLAGHCATHATAILEAFPSWRRLPAQYVGNDTAVRGYAAGLLAVAECMATLGHAGPLQLLTEGGAGPIKRWREAFERANALESAGDLEGAYRAMADIEAEMKDMTGTAVDEYLGKVLGRMGALRHDMDDLTGAMALTSRALEECRRTGDQRGIAAYSQNLSLLRRAASLAGAGASPDPRSRVARAQELSDQALYDASNAALDQLLASERPDVLTEFLGKIHGLRGFNLYCLGDLDQAHAATTLAVAACQRQGDEKGVWVYQRNLQSIERARGGSAGGG